jgi:hypothetical protein
MWKKAVEGDTDIYEKGLRNHTINPSEYNLCLGQDLNWAICEQDLEEIPVSAHLLDKDHVCMPQDLASTTMKNRIMASIFMKIC